MIDMQINRTLKKSGSRSVAKFLQESILIAFDFIWRLLFSSKNFASFLDPPLGLSKKEKLNTSKLFRIIL